MCLRICRRQWTFVEMRGAVGDTACNFGTAHVPSVARQVNLLPVIAFAILILCCQGTWWGKITSAPHPIYEPVFPCDYSSIQKLFIIFKWTEIFSLRSNLLGNFGAGWPPNVIFRQVLAQKGLNCNIQCHLSCWIFNFLDVASILYIAIIYQQPEWTVILVIGYIFTNTQMRYDSFPELIN